jgi:hypothetical protein
MRKSTVFRSLDELFNREMQLGEFEMVWEIPLVFVNQRVFKWVNEWVDEFNDNHNVFECVDATECSRGFGLSFEPTVSFGYRSGEVEDEESEEESEEEEEDDDKN